MNARAASAEVPAGAGRPVRRRHVFYVGGFDPQGPAHYHRLYAQEAVKQAAVSGYAIEVGPRARAGPHAARWAVEATLADGGVVASTVEFLRWDDIVRANWPRSRWAVMLSALATTAHQLGNGVLWKILKTSWPAFLVLFLPPMLVVALLAMLALVALAAGALVLHGHALAALALPGVLAWPLARFATWAEAKVQMAWLMRSTRFILRQARGAAPELDARLAEFARRLQEVRADAGIDEVMIVGHSSGAMLAVSALARCLGPADDPTLAPVSLLTLGECIPVLAYQPQARAFRAEMAVVANSNAVAWIDFTAPPDGCCFALVDPTAACDPQARTPSWCPPKRLSPRFAQLFDAPTYRRLRRDKHRCHFQYLMASQLPGAYDYFAITAGAQRLAQRYAATPGVVEFRDFQMFGGPAA